MTIDLAPPVLDVTASNDVPFRVVRCGLMPSTPAARNKSETHAIIEFYDRRYPHTIHGQFTGGYYYVDTLLGLDDFSNGLGGLDLSGSEPAWKVDADTMEVVRKWIWNHYRHAGEQ